MILISVFISVALLFSEHKVNSDVIDLIMLGEYEMLTENYNEAESYFLQALKIDSTSVTIFLNLAEINLINNNLVEYSKNINKAFLLDPLNIEIGLINSNILLINEKYNESQSLLLDLYQRYPLDLNIQLALIDFFQLTKQWKELIELNFEIYSNDINKEEFLIRALDISIATGNDTIILEKILELLLENPDNTILLSSYLQIIYSNQLYSHAEENLKKLISIVEDKQKLESQLAEIYILLGNFKKSKDILEKIIKGHQLDENMYNLLAITYTNLEQYNSLLFYSNMYIKLRPDNKYAYENKIIALLQLREFDDLIEFSKLSKNKFPEELIFPYILGDAYFSIKDYDNAEQEYLNALDLSDNSRLIRNSLITIYELNSNYFKSDSLFTLLISQDGNDALTLNNYAFSLSERTHFNDETIQYALELSKKALEIEPDNAAFLDTMGWIYYRMENYNLAENYIKNSIKIDNTNSIVLEHLADVYIKKNNINNAIKYYKLALKNDPNNFETQLKIDKHEKN